MRGTEMISAKIKKYMRAFMHTKRQHKINTLPKHLVDLLQFDPPKSLHWKLFDGLFMFQLARP